MGNGCEQNTKGTVTVGHQGDVEKVWSQSGIRQMYRKCGHSRASVRCTENVVTVGHQGDVWKVWSQSGIKEIYRKWAQSGIREMYRSVVTVGH